MRVAAHVFVDDLTHPELRDDDHHHLERVLRLRPGEVVTASDGRGGLRTCRWTADGLTADGDPTHEDRRSPTITVGFALVKSEKPEWIVQKLTECGVDRIVPFTAERSVVQWDEAKTERNLARLRSVSREAAMQSRQRWLPTVGGVTSFAAALDEGAALADGDGDPPSLAHPFVLIGPEGGWSEGERRAASAVDGRFVRFGRSVLRSETAAIAAGVVLTGLRESVIQAVGGRAARS
jgi:16S rRNA (uracil1498-N3)-methyltransferase